MGRLIEVRDRAQWGRGGRVRLAVERAERRFRVVARRGVAELELALLEDTRSVEFVLSKIVGALVAANDELKTTKRRARELLPR